MKSIKFIVFVGIITGFIVFEACDRNKDDEKTTVQTLTGYLVNKGIWTASSVTVPDNSSTLPSQWEGSFTVKFTETNMTASNQPTGAVAVWPSGQWSFKDENANVIIRGDGIEMSVITLTETSFKVSFTYNPNGRVTTIDGPYTFEFN